MQSLIAELSNLGLSSHTTDSLALITIYNATDDSKNSVLKQSNVLLQQNTGNTSHYLIRP